MRLLFVADPNSDNLVSWLLQLSTLSWEIHIATTNSCTEETSQALYFTQIHKLNNYSDSAAFLHTRQESSHANQLAAQELAHLIEQIHPHAIHVFGLFCGELSHASIIAESMRILSSKERTPWLFSSQAGDLDHSAIIPEQQNIAKLVLAHFDYSIGESSLDLRLVRELGFRGTVLEKLPSFGAITLDSQIQSNIESIKSRKTIIFDARDACDGADLMYALGFICAIPACQDILRRYTIVGLRAGLQMSRWIAAARASTNLSISKIDHTLSLQEEQALFDQARVYISLHTHARLNAEAARSMWRGVLPIFSDNSATREWISHDNNGLLVPCIDTIALGRALRVALRDDDLIEHAQTQNIEMIQSRCDSKDIRPRIHALYERALSHTKISNPPEPISKQSISTRLE